MNCLFESKQNQPKELDKILKKWADKISEGLSYKQCKRLQKQVNKIGFTFDYGLSGVPYNLRKI